MIGRIVMVLLAVFIGLAPLALGSNRPLPWAYNAVLAGGIALLCCAILWSERRSRAKLRMDILAAPLVLWALGLAWAALQLVPLGASGLAHPSWGLAAAALEQDASATISVNGEETRASLMRLLTYVSVFLSAFVLARDAERAQFLLRALMIAAAFYAVYGLLRYATAIDKILWFDQPSSPSLASTFVNRNSAATYFGIAACISFAFLLRRIRHLMNEADSEATARRGVERLLGGVAGSFGLELALFVLLLTSVLLTQSRAGVAATLLALALGLLVNRLRLGKSDSGLVKAAGIFIALFAGLAVLQMSGAGFADRMADTDMGTEIRLNVYADTAAAVFDHALMGTGLGTFQDVFPLYRSATAASSLFLDKAHNDYLEILLGLGIPAGGAVIFGIGLVVLAGMRGVFARRRNSHLPLAGTMAGLLVAVHAMFDFSLQIQAVALTFAVALAVAAAQSVSDRTR